jgi:hypothetical protein
VERIDPHLYLKKFLRGGEDESMSTLILGKNSQGQRKTQKKVNLYLESFLKGRGEPKKGEPYI